jgi:hypothetical protein
MRAPGPGLCSPSIIRAWSRAACGPAGVPTFEHVGSHTFRRRLGGVVIQNSTHFFGGNSGMNSVRSSKRAFPPFLAGALSHRRRQAYALAIALLCAIMAVAVRISTGPPGKIDANRLVSPWDRSAAPPPCISRDAVRVIRTLDPHRSAAKPTRGRPRRVSAVPSRPPL